MTQHPELVYVKRLMLIGALVAIVLNVRHAYSFAEVPPADMTCTEAPFANNNLSTSSASGPHIFPSSSRLKPIPHSAARYSFPASRLRS